MRAIVNNPSMKVDHFDDDIPIPLLVNNMSIAVIGIYNGTSSDFKSADQITTAITDTSA